MSVRLQVAILAGFLLSCSVVGERERTSRRSFEIETDESEFISSYDSFLGDIDGNNTYSYWPDGVNPEEEFGLMQKPMISDILIQLCIMSGVYVRPLKPRPKSVGNDSAPVYRMSQKVQNKQQKSQQSASGTGSKRGTPLFDELLDLFRAKREAATTTTETPTTGTGPPVENWQEDPYDMLEDSELQFRNLCISLFELRRLNKRLARQREKAAAP